MDALTVEKPGQLDQWIARYWRGTVTIIILVAIVGASLIVGLRLRRWAWDYTEDCRFQGDVNNAVFWGHEAADSGLFHLYDAVDQAAISDPGRKIDYPPLRLTMAAMWWRFWIHPHYGDASEWQSEYSFTQPMLRANILAELASSALIFAVIRLWKIRQAGDGAQMLTGVVAGTAGALLFWFNPAIIWNAHCWPQWDVWPIPFFLAAVLLASLDWWMAAGVCLAVGASLKGQMLLAAPVMVIWPVARLHFGDALKVVSGFLLASAVIALPWMLPRAGGIVWLVLFVVAIGLLAPWVMRIELKREIVWAMAAAAILLAWPWATSEGALRWRFAAILLMALLACARWLPMRVRYAAAGLVLSLAIFLLMPLYGASSNWFTYGFQYGTEKFQNMVTGNGAFNIPRMLMAYYQWPQQWDDPVSLPWIGEVTFTNAMRIIYAIFLVLCGIGAAIHDRRRETRVLASVVAPWLLFFLILTQMHGRYGVWAAGISALLAGVNWGLAMIGVLVTIGSFLGMVENQLVFARDWSPGTLDTLQNMDPGLAWVMLVCGMAIFYFAMMPMKFRLNAAVTRESGRGS